MYWFSLPIKLPVVIGPVHGFESDVKTQINKSVIEQSEQSVIYQSNMLWHVSKYFVVYDSNGL